jgi:purine-binding chemotaxis protein CheW
VPIAGRQLVLGLIADRVYEVASLDGGRLEPPPDIGTRWHSEYIAGVGRRGEHFVVVFNLGQLFASDEHAFINAETHASEQSAAA